MTTIAITLAVIFGTPVILLAAISIKYKLEQIRFRRIEHIMWCELQQLIRDIEDGHNGR